MKTIDGKLQPARNLKVTRHGFGKGYIIVARDSGLSTHKVWRTRRDAVAALKAYAGKVGNRSRKRSRSTRKNPPIYTGGKRALRDASHMIGIRVFEIRYRHAKDGHDYKHPFETGVMMLGMPDGSLRIESATGKRLWENFDV